MFLLVDYVILGHLFLIVNKLLVLSLFLNNLFLPFRLEQLLDYVLDILCVVSVQCLELSLAVIIE